MKTVKLAFGQTKLAFDFVSYNDCKQRNSAVSYTHLRAHETS